MAPGQSCPKNLFITNIVKIDRSLPFVFKVCSAFGKSGLFFSGFIFPPQMDRKTSPDFFNVRYAAFSDLFDKTLFGSNL